MIYPLTMVDEANGINYTCQDEAEFLASVATILSSGAVHKAISALLAQSKASDIEVYRF